MLVRALCLRYLGVRLTADELRREVPMVGNLRYEEHPNGEHGRDAMTCLLMPLSKSLEPHVQLFRARVRLIDRRGLVIQGSELVWQRQERTTYRQALWAWAVHPDELRRPPPDPVDVEEEAAQVPQILR